MQKVKHRWERRAAYRQYLASEHWALLRSATIWRDGGCVECGGQDELQVHHTRYRTPCWVHRLFNYVERVGPLEARHYRFLLLAWRAYRPAKKDTAMACGICNLLRVNEIIYYTKK